jgi:hypothetical protein
VERAWLHHELRNAILEHDTSHWEGDVLLSIPSDVMMAWGKHSLEQDTGNPETVGMGAEGATANGSRMAGTGAAGSASPAGARATVRLAVSELSTGAVT